MYLELIKALRGHAAVIEIGDLTRPAVEVVRGMIWDVFFGDKLVLLITFTDTAVEKPQAATPLGTPVKAKEFETVREFNFKWVRTANIISVMTDANITINRQTRTLKPTKNEPLYTDEQAKWHVLNNNICRLVIARLRELGLSSTFGGAFRNDTNDAITFEEAFAPPPAHICLADISMKQAPVAVPAPTPVIDVVPSKPAAF